MSHVREPSFAALAREPDADLGELALALAAEFRAVDRGRARAVLDELAVELRSVAASSVDEQVEACRLVLAGRHGFTGDRDDYDQPSNSMLDLVLERRRGLPILLSAVYVEVARRAAIDLAGVGLPGHFVVAHFGVVPPLVLDPFSGGRDVTFEVRAEHLRPWGAHETALRMLNNLVRSFFTRGELANAICAARLRLMLPIDQPGRRALAAELRGLEAQLN